jgi:uncharacterized membrane protein
VLIVAFFFLVLNINQRKKERSLISEKNIPLDRNKKKREKKMTKKFFFSLIFVCMQIRIEKAKKKAR